MVSLREAIAATNNTAGADSIYFAIPGYGVHTINVGSAYALITGSVTIDAYSQPGSQVNTETATDNAVLAVELNGTFYRRPGAGKEEYVQEKARNEDLGNKKQDRRPSPPMP